MRGSRPLLLTLVRAALSLAPLWPGTASGQATTNVPVQDLAYRHVERLVAEGLVDTVHVGQRPYSRRAVARIAAEAERNLPRLEMKASDTTLSSSARAAFARRLGRARAVLAALRAEFGTDGGAGTRLVESAAADWTWTNSPPRVVPSDELGGISAVTNPLVDYQLGRRYVDGGNLAIETTHRVRLLPILAAAARVRTWNGWAEPSDSGGHRVTAEALYGQLALRNVLVEVGRDHLFYGQGMRASLSVSGNAPALDMVKLASDAPFRMPWFLRGLGPTRASFFIADLGERQNFPGAKLIGYKWSFLPSPRVEFGVSVTNQMGGRGSPTAAFGDRLLDLVPIIDPLTLGSRDIEISNKFAGMDVRVRFPAARGLEWYAEFLLDDFDHRRIWGSFRDDAGWISGINLPRLTGDGRLQLTAEVQRTGLRYYQHVQFNSGVTFDNRIIGNALGPKSRAAYLRLSWDQGATSSLSLDGAFELRGNDRYRTAWIDSVENRWRFVKVERRPHETRARIALTWSGEFSPTRPRVFAELGYERVGNFAFVEGRERDNVLGRVGVERRF
jgi:capsule assembly protein Wzi